MSTANNNELDPDVDTSGVPFTEEDVGAEEEEQETPFKMPEKFEGKSAEDIVKSYTELETAYGRQANEFGELRKLTDKALFERIDADTQSTAVNKGNEQPPPSEAVTFEDLVEDPDTAVGKLITSKLESVNRKLDGLEKKERLHEFASEFPDFQADLTDETFQHWVQASKYRVGLFIQTNDYNMDAGRELWTEWNNVKTSKAEEVKAALDAKDKKQGKALKRAASEVGSTGSRTRKVYKRVDLINLRARDPEAYFANIEEYSLAYKEGRVA